MIRAGRPSRQLAGENRDGASSVQRRTAVAPRRGASASTPLIASRQRRISTPQRAAAIRADLASTVFVSTSILSALTDLGSIPIVIGSGSGTTPATLNYALSSDFNALLNDFDDLQRRFRVLVGAWGTTGFPVPEGLEDDFEAAFS